MAEHHFLKFQSPQGTPGRVFPGGWVVTAGDPVATAWRDYAADDGSMIAGHWECTPGAFSVVYDKWEFCHLLSGSCTITPEGAAAVELRAGDAFVVEPGFRGTWTVTQTMRKHFVFKMR